MHRGHLYLDEQSISLKKGKKGICPDEQLIPLRFVSTECVCTCSLWGKGDGVALNLGLDDLLPQPVCFYNSV